jgi:acetyltransferase-like isoleucine patch superfamily enzyme
MTLPIDLKKMYLHESSAQKYKRIVVGKDASWGSFILVEIIFSCFSWVPGALGIVLRKAFYFPLFGSIFASVSINKNVTIRSPGKISLLPGVFIDEFCQLQAISSHQQAIKIGEGSVVNTFCILNAGEPNGFIHIGGGTSIGQATIIYGNGGVLIGNDVLIAGQCFIVASSHNSAQLSIPIAKQGITAKGIIIEDGVWIGAGVKILDGVTIGSGSIIGANSVVNRSIPAGVVAVGAPCKVIKTRQDSF